MELRRSRRSRLAGNTTAGTDRFEAPADRGIAIRTACVVCYKRRAAYVDARSVAGGEENRSADLGNPDWQWTTQNDGVHCHRRRTILNLPECCVDPEKKTKAQPDLV